MRKLIFASFILCLAFVTKAQKTVTDDFSNRPSLVTEVIKPVSNELFKFYFNARWFLVKPVCAELYRICGIDTVLKTYKGKFVDYYICDSSIALEGAYLEGKKTGPFIFYYPNGQLQAYGEYRNDKKYGTWEYYYENGSPLQILSYTEKVPLVLEFWDNSGKKLVDSGNGEWYRYEGSDYFSKISGKIINGRREGTWTRFVSRIHSNINEEKFKNGVFISGLSHSVVNGYKNYNDTSFCAIEVKHEFLNAEEFSVTICQRTKHDEIQYARYPGGYFQFYSELESLFKAKPHSESKGRVQIETTIDNDGKMTAFKAISNTGLEVNIIDILKTMKNWTPRKVNGKLKTDTRIVVFKVN